MIKPGEKNKQDKKLFSPKWTFEMLRDAEIDELIKAFIDRMEGWYFQPLEFLLRRSTGEAKGDYDFISLAIECMLIDALAGYYYGIAYWLTYFNLDEYVVMAIILAVLVMVAFMLKGHALPFAIFTTGFAASSLELLLLISFQTLYGYVYQQVGLIVTVFMFGLALGSYGINKNIERLGKKALITMELGVVIYSLLLPLSILYISMLPAKLEMLMANTVFPLLTLVISMLVGMEFPVAAKFYFRNKRDIEETTGRLYAADLGGACIGALAMSIFLIPLFGVIHGSIFVGLLNAASLLVLLSKG